ncbi:putative protein phosphatases pp1 regulatory subunit [Neospora caninum Liverpool]|uniref:Folate-binding protein YgfZ protein n=1 Tax=Neospora caninum (strain Liverpool) TaxID=572307 RepID=F0VAN2_NEOCL|nr:putative protein phosphatases pp1 regulatory subunit [Neospora caninum Liverpool]CBZ50787.1 putative protein phosphatases pp1 regulatory subunit [Neospora caninum Liverpool]|eukprot:XP_003880820.1 putative protein phosphatases pp1 regulatory subunit [Neospora caninum Liverpool]
MLSGKVQMLLLLKGFVGARAAPFALLNTQGRVLLDGHVVHLPRKEAGEASEAEDGLRVADEDAFLLDVDAAVGDRLFSFLQRRRLSSRVEVKGLSVDVLQLLPPACLSFSPLSPFAFASRLAGVQGVAAAREEGSPVAGEAFGSGVNLAGAGEDSSPPGYEGVSAESEHLLRLWAHAKRLAEHLTSGTPYGLLNVSGDRREGWLLTSVSGNRDRRDERREDAVGADREGQSSPIDGRETPAWEARNRGLVTVDGRSPRMGFRVYVHSGQGEEARCFGEEPGSGPADSKTTAQPPVFFVDVCGVTETEAGKNADAASLETRLAASSFLHAYSPSVLLASRGLSSPQLYELRRRALGVPEGPAEVGIQRYLLQHLNMDWQAYIHPRVNKGCFLGQEVVTRALLQLSNRRRLASFVIVSRAQEAFSSPSQGRESPRSSRARAASSPSVSASEVRPAGEAGAHGVSPPAPETPDASTLPSPTSRRLPALAGPQAAFPVSSALPLGASREPHSLLPQRRVPGRCQHDTPSFTHLFPPWCEHFRPSRHFPLPRDSPPPAASSEPGRGTKGSLHGSSAPERLAAEKREAGDDEGELFRGFLPGLFPPGELEHWARILCLADAAAVRQLERPDAETEGVEARRAGEQRDTGCAPTRGEDPEGRGAKNDGRSETLEAATQQKPRKIYVYTRGWTAPTHASPREEHPEEKAKRRSPAAASGWTEVGEVVVEPARERHGATLGVGICMLRARAGDPPLKSYEDYLASLGQWMASPSPALIARKPPSAWPLPLLCNFPGSPDHAHAVPVAQGAQNAPRTDPVPTPEKPSSCAAARSGDGDFARSACEDECAGFARNSQAPEEAEQTGDIEWCFLGPAMYAVDGWFEQQAPPKVVSSA